MKVAVSRCLLGENCKYSGGNNYDEALCGWLQGHEIIPVCPEVSGGLPIPREPCEIVAGTVQTAGGISCDAQYRHGAKIELEKLKSAGAQLAVLQARSPSCGCRHIYDGTFSGRLIRGSGIFAQLLHAEGITAVDTEERDKLENVLAGKC